MLLEMKSLDIGLCPGVVAPARGVGAAQGIVAILLPSPELAPVSRTCGTGGAQRGLAWGSAGAGLCRGWVHENVEMWSSLGESLC